MRRDSEFAVFCEILSAGQCGHEFCQAGAIGRGVLGAIDGHVGDSGHRQFQRGEKALEIAFVITAAELDHSDTLPFPVGVAREAVEFRDVVRGKRRAPRPLHARRGHVAPRARAVVQAEHAFDAAGDGTRKVNWAGERAMRAAFVLVLIKLHTKGFAEIAGAALQHHAVSRGGGFENLKAIVAGEALDACEIAGMRAVVGLKFFAREIVAEARQRGGELAIIMQWRGRAAVAQH